MHPPGETAAESAADAIAGLVLAGGASRRMDGRDKALLDLGGETLVCRAIRRLRQQARPVALSANGDPRRFPIANTMILADHPGFYGPLAGIFAGMEWARTLLPKPRFLLSVAVDGPFFPDDLGIRLAGAALGAATGATRGAGAPPIAVARANAMLHPTFALWPLEAAPGLRAYLRSGGRKVRAFQAEHGFVAVDFPTAAPSPSEIDPFLNINSAEDHAQAQAALSQTAYAENPPAGKSDQAGLAGRPAPFPGNGVAWAAPGATMGAPAGFAGAGRGG